MRWSLLACVLLIGGLAAAAPTSVPMESGTCYECHAPGLWVPPMEPPRISEYRFVPDGAGWWLEADVQNTWTDAKQGLSGVLDTSMHAGLKPAAQGNGSQQTFTGSFGGGMPMGAAQSHELDVPATTQSLRAELRSEGVVDHDLALSVYPPGADEPCAGVVSGGAGQPDTVEFAVEQLAGTGPGTWRFEVLSKGLETPETFTYSLEVTLGTEVQQKAIAWADDAAAGATSTLRWPVAVVDEGTGPVAIALRFTSYYDHTGSEPDAEFQSHTVSVEAATAQGRPDFAVHEQEADDESAPGLPLLAPAGVLALVAWRRR